jgi:U3 small nucleolar RNA-associated protein 19
LHSTSSKPTFHIVHFKKIVCALLLCPSPSRGRRVGNSLDNNHLDLDVRDHFVDIWLNVHDDIRWFFLREAPYVLLSALGPSNFSAIYLDRLILNSATSEDAPANLLSILERWTKFPIDANDLKTWWVEELGTKPHQKKGKSTALQDDHDDSGPDDTDGDDWRKFFDDNDDGPPSLAKPFTPRLFKLSTHQSLHTLASHRAVFTQAWLTLLPRLPVTNQALSTRALNIMHRGVMPHLVRPILVMDWIGTCVDFGMFPVIGLHCK